MEMMPEMPELEITTEVLTEMETMVMIQTLEMGMMVMIVVVPQNLVIM